jgi:asparagine synthase (glutamine-hydrolysing)
MLGSRLQTFSVTFEDPAFDESGFQQDVVKLNATEHHSLRCSYDDICAVFPDVVRHAERPILRTAPAPLFLLSRLVRDSGFKVVLTGEGADEFLGGYDIFKEAKIRCFWAGQIESHWRPLLLKRLYPYLQNLQAQSDAYRRRFFHVDSSELGSPFFSHLPRWDLTARSKLFLSDEVRRQLGSCDAYREAEEALPTAFAGWNGFSRAQYLEAAILLPGYILSSQGDRMSMAHSVEGRFPFLDHRVIEFAGNLPARLKMKTLNEKYILKRAAGHLVPESIRSRPKQPYRAPDARSFFDSETGKARAVYVDDLLSADRLREFGLFNPTAVEKLADKARRGQVESAKDNMALVGVLSTQLLVEQLISHSGRVN